MTHSRGAASLLLVGHGSPDPRSADALRAVARAVSAQRPEMITELAFLETSTPTITDAAARLPRQRPMIVVPLLLAAGYHTEVDLPVQLEPLPHQEIIVAPPLGPDPLLDAALRRRLAEVGAPFDAPACQVIIGSARKTPQELVTAVTAARDSGASRVVLASYLLAPGRFHDQLLELGADHVTAPLAGAPELVDLVLQRASQAAAGISGVMSARRDRKL